MIFDIQPSEEVNLLRETVREFAAKEIAPIVGTPAAWLLHVSEHMLRGTLEAIQALGGNGDINAYPTGRQLQDAKLFDIGADTNEIRRIRIGRELFEETQSA